MAAERQMEQSDSDEFRGTVLYNLGCHYAITGQNSMAIAKIQRSLELYPALKQWLPEDSDLAKLRDDPEFAELIT